MADVPDPSVADPSDDPSSDAADSADAADGSGTSGSGRTLDRRTIAICAVIGLVAALLTALIGSALLSDDSANGDMELQDAEAINTEKLFAQPLDTVDGGTTDLAAFQEDQPMLVNLWASNCPPCIDEMPLLNDASDDNPGITFVGVATQDDYRKAKALAKQTEITYPWALDPTGEFFYVAEGLGMPTTLLLAADGTVVDSKTGPFHNASELQAFLDQAA